MQKPTSQIIKNGRYYYKSYTMLVFYFQTIGSLCSLYFFPILFPNYSYLQKNYGLLFWTSVILWKVFSWYFVYVYFFYPNTALFLQYEADTNVIIIGQKIPWYRQCCTRQNKSAIEVYDIDVHHLVCATENHVPSTIFCIQDTTYHFQLISIHQGNGGGYIFPIFEHQCDAYFLSDVFRLLYHIRARDNAHHPQFIFECLNITGFSENDYVRKMYELQIRAKDIWIPPSIVYVPSKTRNGV